MIDKISKIVPANSDPQYVTLINHVCMKIVLELKELSPEDDDGQPSIMATKYLVVSG